MKLKSGCLLWPSLYRGAVARFPPLVDNKSCDVAIIGGGISGALMAYLFVRQGLNVILVDCRDIAQGSTAASTGLLQYEIDVPLIDLIKKLGHDRAVAAYQASLEALLAFEPLVAELGGDCGFAARPSLYLASDETDVPSLKAECEARRSIGIDVKFLSASALRDAGGPIRSAALLSRHAFEVNPYALTLCLVDRSVAAGLTVHAHTEITRLHWQGDRVTLHTNHGPRIDAGHIVFATGYETMEKLPPGLCKFSSTYAAASEPTGDSPWPERALIWETARPYLYARTTADGRILVGGADEPFVDPARRDALISVKAEALRVNFQQLFPHIELELNCAWAGTFAETADGLPCIGSLPQYPRSYFALGYGGNGITFSLLAAQIIRDAILKKPHPRANLFAFDR